MHAQLDPVQVEVVTPSVAMPAAAVSNWELCHAVLYSAKLPWLMRARG